MPDPLQTGRLGENIARKYLTGKGYSIIAANFRTRYGEIDLICRKGDRIAFVEVKTRTGTGKGNPWEAITPRKLTHIQKAAQLFVLQNKMKEYKLSMQAVSIVLDRDMQVLAVDHFEDVLL